MLDFATKTSYTFQAALKILEEKPQYNFTILKDLTQVPVVRDNPTESKEIAPLDFDQMLFFKVSLRMSKFVNDIHCNCYVTLNVNGVLIKLTLVIYFRQEDFEDEVKETSKEASVDKVMKKTNDEISKIKSQSIQSTPIERTDTINDSTIFNLLDITTDEPSETDCLLDMFSSAANACKPIASTQSSSSSTSASNILSFDFLKNMHSSNVSSETSKKDVIKAKKTSAWMDLFADLDPLANPTTMEKKIAGSNQNWLDA